ncbi:MAG: phage virion morphogenesis protein [Treponema sp.]|jgi:phage virion morphogenesis protein|nr:phage virion morphogenesis protein [Treponema sp.]
MGTAIEVRTQEIETLARNINAWSLSVTETRSLLKSLGKELEEQTVDRFDTEQDPEGSRWRKLTAAYAKRKVGNSLGGILVYEGDMRDSIESQVQAADSVLIGSSKDYAAYHQHAKHEKRRRRFLGISLDNRDDLQDLINTFMEQRGL